VYLAHHYHSALLTPVLTYIVLTHSAQLQAEIQDCVMMFESRCDEATALSAMPLQLIQTAVTYAAW
jgi:predicted component of type VI protein secretion system